MALILDVFAVVHSIQGKIFCEELYCRTIYPEREKSYEYFKGRRLCTSKRPNKNYFDYVKSSININKECKKGLKRCGKLDVNRILCVKDEDNCPINDINFQKFFKQNFL